MAEVKLMLVSEDGIKFPVSLQVVRCIGLFKNLLELHVNSGQSTESIPPFQVSNVNSLILDKIIEYLNNYVSTRDVSASLEGGNRSSKGINKVKNTIANVMRIENKAGSSATTTSASIDDDGNFNDQDDDEDDSLYSERRPSRAITPSAAVAPSATPFDGKDEFEGEFEMMSDDDGDDEVFDFANFDEQSLRLFTPYEQSFFAALEIPTLIEITKAANYMNIPHLLDSCCKAIANHMKGLTVEELRAKFNIKNDFTPEEEERVRRETAWVEE